MIDTSGNLKNLRSFKINENDLKTTISYIDNKSPNYKKFVIVNTNENGLSTPANKTPGNNLLAQFHPFLEFNVDDKKYSINELMRKSIEIAYTKTQQYTIKKNMKKSISLAVDYEQETQRLIELFPKWRKKENKDKIALFMKNGLDPNKKYTRFELMALCKEYSISQQHITNSSTESNRSNHYGKIMIKKDDCFCLDPDFKRRI